VVAEQRLVANCNDWLQFVFGKLVYVLMSRPGKRKVTFLYDTSLTFFISFVFIHVEREHKAISIKADYDLTCIYN